MECFKIEDLSFRYPTRENKALYNINLVINQGEFVTLCGKSGCGKTTLLRLLKSALSPHGEITGKIYFEGKTLSEYDIREQTSKIGFVMQSPDNQIVTDKVWHELAFGLESLGYSTPEIRTRVSEMASFFGIQNWFYKNVTELSGGQKQLLNLASIMVMQPSVLILDEPTSQLDPIAAQEFLNTLEKINRELGTTIILTEHRLEEALPISDRVIVLDNGKVIADDKPREVGRILKELDHEMYIAFPTPMRVYGAVENNLDCPMTVREGREWLEKYSESNELDLERRDKDKQINRECVIDLKDVWFRYEKDSQDIIKGLELKVNRGVLFAIVGGNGTGKTTALSVISGINTPYRGEVRIFGVEISNIANLYTGILGVLPQNPQSLFVKKTVYLDLMEIFDCKKISKTEKEEMIKNISTVCRIGDLLESHPYDLSGGEQQRVALAKVLLQNPRILLLDEPTKGMDAHFKEEFAEILSDLKANGVTILMVSHDIEFCAEYADRCAMFFDGNITSSATPREFFAGNSFYTTSANRMARTKIPDAVLAEDIILACGGNVMKKEKNDIRINLPKEEEVIKKQNTNLKKLSPLKIAFGIIFALLFVLTCVSFMTDNDILNLKQISWLDTNTLQLISIVEIACALLCFLPNKESKIDKTEQSSKDRKLSKRTLLATFLVLLAIPLTIFVGVYFLGDRKYYFISILIILEIMIPFFVNFEGKKPQARELVLISMLCAIAVAGRMAFFMIPQFKPVIAMIILVGVCFGAETGFLVGAVIAFISNFFFGQGPWTQWQMFVFGLIGFVSGILFRKGLVKKNKLSLSIYGFIATIVIYGGIMNPTSIIMMQTKPTLDMVLATYAMGFPFDFVHAISTVFFLWFISEPLIEKLERIKVKYGLIEH